jgi:hypothetical protein
MTFYTRQALTDYVASQFPQDPNDHTAHLFVLLFGIALIIIGAILATTGGCL